MWKPIAETTRKAAGGKSTFYGWGWFIDEVKGHRLVSHGGSLPGFRAALLRFVDDKLTVIVLTIGNGANPEGIAKGIAAFYLPDLKVISTK